MTIEKQNIEDLIRSEYEKGNIAFIGVEGLIVVSIKDFIAQGIEGMLYDLNRSEEVILTLVKDNPKWINDFALTKLIRELYKQLENKNKLV